MAVSSRIATAAGTALVTAFPALADELVDVESDCPLVVAGRPLIEFD
ncbi:hypothetical protein [Lentzea pudingi]|nr:hypothetical protein [Lentzea pudingi]